LKKKGFENEQKGNRMSYTQLFISADPKITYTERGVDTAVRVLGVPFDYTSCYRPGSRFAPNAIRSAFQNIEIYSRPLGIDLERVSIEDLGNMRQTAKVEDMVTSVQKVMKELLPEEIPVGVLGGEHSITYATFSVMPKEVGLIVFDAHLDLREEFSGLSLSHATFLRRLLDTIHPNRVLHIGGRAATEAEWRYLEQNSMESITPEDVSSRPDESIRRISRFSDQFDSVYISVDLDGIDPAYAPGVGTPEPNGLSTREFFQLIYALKGARVAAFDIVELAPPFDSGITAVLAAKILSEISCLCVFRRKSPSPQQRRVAKTFSVEVEEEGKVSRPSLAK
jgi:agmatinase